LKELPDYYDRLEKMEEVKEAKDMSQPSNEQHLVADFCEEGLTGLGIFDDGDEMFIYRAQDNGIKDAIKEVYRWNAVIRFVNRTLGKNHKEFTEQDIKDWSESV